MKTLRVRLRRRVPAVDPAPSPPKLPRDDKLARIYRALTFVLSLAFVGVGVALLAVTAAHGGGAGYLFGALFIAAGAAGVYLLLRR